MLRLARWRGGGTGRSHAARAGRQVPGAKPDAGQRNALRVRVRGFVRVRMAVGFVVVVRGAAAAAGCAFAAHGFFGIGIRAVRRGMIDIRIGLLRLQAKHLQQGHVGIAGGVLGGEELAAVEDGVGAGVEAERLGFAGEAGAAGGEAHFAAGQGDARDGDDAGELKGVYLRVAFQRGAGHGHQGVDGYAFGLRVQGGEDLQHAQAVVHGFAQAQNAAAAHGHAGALHVGDGLQPVVKRVSGDDVGVVLRAGVDVVVISGYAGFAKSAGGIGAQVAQGYAYFHAQLAYLANGLQYGFEARVAIAHALPGGAHAKAGTAGLGGAAGDGHDFGGGHEALGLNACIIAGALGAVAAILATAAGFDAEQGAQLHLGFGPVFLVHSARAVQELEEREVIEAVEFGKSHGIDALCSLRRLPGAT